jgi:hypothetical protein
VRSVSLKFDATRAKCHLQVVKTSKVSRNLGGAHDMLSRPNGIVPESDRLLDTCPTEQIGGSEGTCEGEDVGELHLGFDGMI